MVTKVFTLPDLGEGLQEATILEWLVDVGQAVAQDEPFVEVETTKSAIVLPSPVAGVIRERHGEAGDVLAVGAPLVTFAADDAAAPGIVGVVPTEAPPRRRVHLSAPKE
jgi:pyruvate dehydrogenase E2 component (dihydrolipoamide acetyltransferase)